MSAFKQRARPFRGLSVFQIWRECRQIVGDTFHNNKYTAYYCFSATLPFSTNNSISNSCAKWPLFLDPVTYTITNRNFITNQNNTTRGWVWKWYIPPSAKDKLFLASTISNNFHCTLCNISILTKPNIAS